MGVSFLGVDEVMALRFFTLAGFISISSSSTAERSSPYAFDLARGVALSRFCHQVVTWPRSRREAARATPPRSPVRARCQR